MASMLPEEDLNLVLANTDWEALRDARVFLTGSSGPVGRWLLETLFWANARKRLGTRVVILTRDPNSFRSRAPWLAANPLLEYVKGDVAGFPFPPGEFSHVIHAPAVSFPHASEGDPWPMVDSLVQGTRRALDFAVSAKAKRVLFTSSCAVYGAPAIKVGQVPENYPGTPDLTDPASACGEAHRLAEFLCNSFRSRHGIETVMARCFPIMGPHFPLDEASPVGAGPCSYLYAADLAVWLWTLLLKSPAGGVYNVGSSETISNADLAQLVSSASVVPVGASAKTQSAAEGPVALSWIPSTDRACNELGLKQITPLAEAVKKTVRWFRQHHSHRSASSSE